MKNHDKGKANNGNPRPQLLASLISPLFSIQIDFMDIPERLGEALGIGTIPAQILLSGIIMLTFLLPLTLLTRKGRGSWLPEVAVTFVIMGFCVVIDWLPYWFMLILALLTALMFAGTMRDLITGRGK